MAAKKLPAKKMAATPKPPAPKEKLGGFQQSLSSAVDKRKAAMAAKNAAEQAARAASDKKVLAEAAKLNQRFRATDKKLNVGGGLINMTYRNQDGKLENSVMNRRQGTAFPKDDVIYMYDKDKPKMKPMGPYRPGTFGVPATPKKK